MRIHAFSLALVFALIANGCQNSTPAPIGAMSSSQRAVVVNGGNGGGTTVFIPTADPANPVVLCTASAEACPECKAAAIKYFSTGILDPKCSRSGAIRVSVMPAVPNVSHN